MHLKSFATCGTKWPYLTNYLSFLSLFWNLTVYLQSYIGFKRSSSSPSSLVFEKTNKLTSLTLQIFFYICIPTCTVPDITITSKHLTFFFKCSVLSFRPYKQYPCKHIRQPTSNDGGWIPVFHQHDRRLILQQCRADVHLHRNDWGWVDRNYIQYWLF